MAKETDTSAKLLAVILDNIGASTASRASLHGGVLADWVINTADKNPDSFKQEPDENGQIFYSLKKEDTTDTPNS